MEVLKIYLNVPFKDSPVVKKLGAIWDEEGRGWWVDGGKNREPFQRWLPRMYRTGINPPHITCDLVPESTWFLNLRSLLPREQWDRVRKETYKKAGYRCQVCGGRGPKWPVECNEQWQYLPDPENPRRGIQKLLRLAALCPECHSIKHAGLANIRGNLEKTIAHMSSVNGWGDLECRQHLNEAVILAEERNDKIWSFDLSLLSDYGIKKIIIDLENAKEIPCISGISLSYRGIAHLFNKTSCTVMCRNFAKFVSQVYPQIKWVQLPEACPAWAAEIKKPHGQQIILVSCVTDKIIAGNDLDVLRTFIQTKTSQNKLVVLIVSLDEKTENHLAIYENIHAVHPLYMEVRWERDDKLSLVDGDLKLSPREFFKKLQEEFKFAGWDKGKVECGAEFLKDRCISCDQPIYRFSGIVLPDGRVSNWSSSDWKYHAYINFYKFSNDLMEQVVPVLSKSELYNDIAKSRLDRIGKRIFVACPYCGQEQKPDFFMGNVDDHTRFGALGYRDARLDKMIYSGVDLVIDYLTMRNVDGEFEFSDFSSEKTPQWE